MERNEFKNLMQQISVIYEDRFVVTQSKFDLWFGLLKDLDFGKAYRATREWIIRSAFPPTIADIRKGVEEQIEAEKAIELRVKEVYEAVCYAGKDDETERVFMEAVNKLPKDKQIKGAEWLRDCLSDAMKEGGTEPFADVVRRAS
ncbi:MAG: hypothetical protein IJP92_00625 [Lachnospiraceae bacterium]|nr:hypothetical protein [Lachnospiraceae bacterium]